MAKYKEHCKECLMKLGEEYPEVHLWLDEFAKEYPIFTCGDYHRQFRHNREGIEYVRCKWGDGAAKAAELHILTDMGYIKNWESVKINLD